MDDDEVINGALTAIGDQRHTQAAANGQITNPTHSSRRGHRKACITDAVNDPELRAQVADIRRAHPEWTSTELAEHAELAATNGHTSARCGVCGSADHPGAACLLDPADQP